MLTEHYKMSWCNIQSPAYFLLGCNIHYYLNSIGPHKDRYLYLKLWYLRYNFFSSCTLHKHSIEDHLIMNNLNFMNMDSAHTTIHFFMTCLIGNHCERYTSLSHKMDYFESIILNLCISFLHRGPETQWLYYYKFYCCCRTHLCMIFKRNQRHVSTLCHCIWNYPYLAWSRTSKDCINLDHKFDFH